MSKQSDAKPVLYVGPTIAGVGSQGTVYTKVPDGARAAADTCPLLLSLFIPIREYAKAEIMLRTKTGYISAAFNEALTYRENQKVRK